MNTWYNLTGEQVLEEFQSSYQGLKNQQVASQKVKFGKNVLDEAKQKSKLLVFLSQFANLMTVTLLIAAAISFFVGEHTDAYVILAIVVGNAWIGFSQENSADTSIRLLQKISTPYSLVKRANNLEKIEASELVPGDLIILEAGDIVPADARLINVSAFKTDEAALTGESQSINKIPDVILGLDLGPADQLNMVFRGTIVSNGSALAIVTATAMQTQIGKIASLLNVQAQKTPLQKRLTVFSKQLALIVVLICVVVFAFGLWRGEPPFLMFLTALSLAVAALPESLPAVITIALSKGVGRMVKQNALVRHLPAVETLGSVTYICSDKTGTLTRNLMSVERIQAQTELEQMLLHAMMLANEVRYSSSGGFLGDSTEIALVKYALAHGNSQEDLEAKYPLVSKHPFDSVRMRMSTLHQYEDKFILFVKGAPEKIIQFLSDKHSNQTQKLLDLNREWAADGYRVLFFGYRLFDQKPEKLTDDLEIDLEFLGMTAMIDPPRDEVIGSIQECRTAGIKIVMVTGDQPLTAHAVAERLHIINNGADQIKTGADLNKWNESEFQKQVRDCLIYARVSPEQKLNIVNALQSNGEIVAMTGDGLNDAPSLKKADIGIAMGINGTDVSRQAADMILLDDNFASIVKAVKEGRRIYGNIRKFILYVLSGNLAEILVIFLAPFLGLPIPLLPTHILWINLATDGLPGIALTAEPAEPDVMTQPPIPPKESLFARGLAFKVLLSGMVMACACLFIQVWARKKGYDLETQQSIVFTLLCFTQLGNAISVRSASNSMFKVKISTNPGLWIAILVTMSLQLCLLYVPALQKIFKTSALECEVMTPILLVTFACILGFEFIKYATNKQTVKRN